MPDEKAKPAPAPSATAAAERAMSQVERAASKLQTEASAGDAAVAAMASAARQAGGSTDAVPFEAPSFDRVPTAQPTKGIDLLSDVNLNVKIELGRTRMLVEDVLKLADGAVIELDKLAGDPVDVYVNDRPVARGEVLVLNDNFCVRINEIIAGVVDATDAGTAKAKAG
jgi:flagellar motor switch protein FliN/FliY